MCTISNYFGISDSDFVILNPLVNRIIDLKLIYPKTTGLSLTNFKISSFGLFLTSKVIQRFAVVELGIEITMIGDHKDFEITATWYAYLLFSAVA